MASLDQYVVCIDFECAAVGKGHWDVAPCLVSLVDCRETEVMRHIIKVDGLKDPMTVFTGLKTSEIAAGDSLDAVRAKIKAFLSEKQKRFSGGVHIVGSFVHVDIFYAGLVKGVHYNCATDLVDYFRTGKYRYGLRKLAYALLGVDMRGTGFHDPAQDCALSVRLWQKYKSGGRTLHLAKNKLSKMGRERKFPDFHAERGRMTYKQCNGMFNPRFCDCGQPTGRGVDTVAAVKRVYASLGETRFDDKKKVEPVLAAADLETTGK